ncbi:glycosyltransferase family 9 protein [Candidatus Pseudothioglobus sp. Uisw_086]|uniref:glycosyltransferase family 9 protein n=1 Tax=Candidatus Pseudothioglobus sp. Uisw_086 TaxID=3230998 RepID=UPI003A83618D
MIPSKILVIIQRSNGDVFLSAPLIQQLQQSFQPCKIDLLINDDTLAVAKILPHISDIHTFSYVNKNEKKWYQEKNIFKKIYKKYDLSINLTASDRSVLYCILASKCSISAIEEQTKKSWWKKILLSHYYVFDNKKHILLNNLEPLKSLNINKFDTRSSLNINSEKFSEIRDKLSKLKISKFFIFHPSAQYNYKVYPQHLRNQLLSLLNELNVPIIVTGGMSHIDIEINKTLPTLSNVTSWIGKTSIEDCIALSSLSEGYIGMDTLNMHIAAFYNKRIFAIFGPTNLSMWAPWSNELQVSTATNIPLQTYGNVSVFQADLACVACGKAGCDDKHGKSECLDHISPLVVFNEVKNWHLSR